MIKKITLLIIIFLVTGCGVNYNIYIDEKYTVKEEIMLQTNSNMMDENYDDIIIDKILFSYKLDYIDYVFDNYEIDNSAVVKLSNEYSSLYDFEEESIIFNEIELSKTIVDGNDTISLNIQIPKDFLDSEQFIFDTDSLKINIITPFKVLDSNATSRTKNTYTWEINKYNEETSISITLDKNRKTNMLYFLGSEISTILLIVMAGLVVITIAVLTIMKSHNKENNKL